MQGFGPKCKDFFGAKMQGFFFTSPKLSSKTHLRHLQACRHASTFRCMCTNEVSSCKHTLHIKGLSLKCMVFVRQSLLHTHTHTHCTSKDYHACTGMTSRALRQSILHTHIAHQRTILQTMYLVCYSFLAVLHVYINLMFC